MEAAGTAVAVFTLVNYLAVLMEMQRVIISALRG